MTTSILQKIRGAIADPFGYEALNKSTADLSNAFQEFYKSQAKIAEATFQLGVYVADKARAGDEEAIGLLNRYEVRLEDADGTVLWDYTCSEPEKLDTKTQVKPWMSYSTPNGAFNSDGP